MRVNRLTCFLHQKHMLWLIIATIGWQMPGCSQGPSAEIFGKEPVYQQRSSKRGVSFGFQYVDDVDVLGKSISWSYNWAPSQAESIASKARERGVDFCPMAWNGIDEEVLRKYVSNNPECSYLMAFNEPNLLDQANMTPLQVAEKWPEIKGIAKELGLKIVSPAMNYGTMEGYHDPIVWLDEFFSLVPLADVDAISIHCYMASPEAVKWYIGRFKKYGKPIWLTEFCAWDGLSDSSFTAIGQQEFMSDMINYLECEPMIERYAWFLPRGGSSETEFPYMFLLKNAATTELTDLGQVFSQMSSQDTTIYYAELQKIEAEHYNSICIEDCVGKDGWIDGPKVRLSKDEADQSLDVYNFLPGQWIEYQFEVGNRKAFELELRYACKGDAEVSIFINGALHQNAVLKTTGSDSVWANAMIPIVLKEGKNKLRIRQNKGVLSMNWLQFS